MTNYDLIMSFFSIWPSVFWETDQKARVPACLPKQWERVYGFPNAFAYQTCAIQRGDPIDESIRRVLTNARKLQDNLDCSVFQFF